LLIVLEKTFQNEQAVRRQFVRLDVAVEFRSFVATAMTLSSLAPNRSSSSIQWPRFDQRQRLHRLLAQNEHIKGIIVLAYVCGMKP